MSEDLQWSKENMIQVELKEPDDFLKVRETLTRIGVASRKKRSCTSPATSFIRKDSIISSTLKSCLL